MDRKAATKISYVASSQACASATNARATLRTERSYRWRSSSKKARDHPLQYAAQVRHCFPSFIGPETKPKVVE
jgi:hypothetical protein